MLLPEQGILEQENRALKREMVFLPLILYIKITALKQNTASQERQKPPQYE